LEIKQVIPVKDRIILSGSLDIESVSGLIINQPFGYLDDISFKLTVVENIKEKYK